MASWNLPPLRMYLFWYNVCRIICTLYRLFWDILAEIHFVAWTEPCNNAVEGFHPLPQPCFSCRHSGTANQKHRYVHSYTYIRRGNPVIWGTVIVTWHYKLAGQCCQGRLVDSRFMTGDLNGMCFSTFTSGESCSLKYPPGSGNVV